MHGHIDKGQKEKRCITEVKNGTYVKVWKKGFIQAKGMKEGTQDKNEGNAAPFYSFIHLHRPLHICNFPFTCILLSLHMPFPVTLPSILLFTYIICTLPFIPPHLYTPFPPFLLPFTHHSLHHPSLLLHFSNDHDHVFIHLTYAPKLKHKARVHVQHSM